MGEKQGTTAARAQSYLVTGDFGHEHGRALGVYEATSDAEACMMAERDYAGRASVENLQARPREAVPAGYTWDCEGCGLWLSDRDGAQCYYVPIGGGWLTLCEACARKSGPTGCATCAGLGHPSGGPECPECGK